MKEKIRTIRVLANVASEIFNTQRYEAGVIAFEAMKAELEQLAKDLDSVVNTIQPVVQSDAQLVAQPAIEVK